MAQATTSILLNALRGKAGSVVFVNTKTGVSVRPRVTPTNPQTPLQQQTRQAMHRASQLFSSFDPATAKQWNSYAATLKTFDEATGRMKAPSGQNVFAGLACKLWQMETSVDVPTTPPISPFLGDGITVDVTAEDGYVVFAASGGNSANVVTELLIQPLKSGAVSPQKRAYRSAQFVAFTGSLRYALVDGLSGWVACAVRFVRSDTGQASPLLELGVVQVELQAGPPGPPSLGGGNNKHDSLLRTSPTGHSGTEQVASTRPGEAKNTSRDFLPPNLGGRGGLPSSHLGGREGMPFSQDFHAGKPRAPAENTPHEHF